MQLSGQRKSRKARKLPQQRLPNAARVTYTKRLNEMLAVFRALVKEKVIPTLGRFVRKDALDDSEIELILNDLRIEFGKRYSTQKLREMARTFADDINAFNEAEMNVIFTKVIGIPVQSIPSLEKHLNTFIRENVRLIESVPEAALSQIEGVINRGARTGARAEDMAVEIYDRVDVSASKAQFIARDQTNKLYGELTQLRQTETGVTSYVWRTSRDEKVRPSHQVLDGKLIQWDNPPDVGHPGADFRCRCTSDPNLEELLTRLESGS